MAEGQTARGLLAMGLWRRPARTLPSQVSGGHSPPRLPPAHRRPLTGRQKSCRRPRRKRLGPVGDKRHGVDRGSFRTLLGTDTRPKSRTIPSQPSVTQLFNSRRLLRTLSPSNVAPTKPSSSAMSNSRHEAACRKSCDRTNYALLIKGLSSWQYHEWAVQADLRCLGTGFGIEA